MKSIGVRVLKDNLSKYLHYVKEGETILVTDHNEVIAELKKPDSIIDTSHKFNLFLAEEEKRGNLKKASQKRKLLTPPEKIKSKIKKEDWWKIYEQVRSDRSQ